MSLFSYAEAARRIAEEIAASFETDPGAAAALRAAVATMTVRDWIEWCTDAADEVAEFASATPSARRRRRWKRPSPLLHLAAHQFCLRAALLLEAADLMIPGDSYRNTLRAAGNRAARLEEALLDVDFRGFHEDRLPFKDLPSSD